METHVTEEENAENIPESSKAGLEPRPLNTQEESRSFFSQLKLFIKVLLVCFSVAIVWTSRNDSSVNTLVSSKILPLERAFGSAISPIKSLLGIEMKLTTDELFQQIEKGNLAAVKMLLDGGVDPNGQNTVGDTPLAFAARSQKIEAVKMLLENKANPNIANVEGFYPIHYAIENGYIDIVKVLAETGADLNARDDAELTALMMTASKPGVDILSYLIERKAELDLQDERGFSALMHAVITDNAGAVVSLLDARANASILDHQGKSAVELVPIGGAVEKVFIERGLITEEMMQKSLASSEVELDELPEQDSEETKPTPQPARITRTRVRAKGRPVGVWKNAQSITLESVKVEVRNYGGVSAQNVLVQVRIPGGKMLTLSGPRNLDAYQESTYSIQSAESIRQNGKLKAFVSCQNCYR